MENLFLECLVQKSSQCQEHWVTHPDKFKRKEDIEVEKNLYFHNGKLVKTPRDIAVQIIKFSGIKKSCDNCKEDVEDHFKEHMFPHLQCKLCLFMLRDATFWKMICYICNKNMVNFSAEQIKRHKRYHEKGFFGCQFCKYKTQKKFNMTRHLEEVHNHYKSSDEDISDCDESEGVSAGDNELSIHDSESGTEWDSNSDNEYGDDSDTDEYDDSLFKQDLFDPFVVKVKRKTRLFPEKEYVCTEAQCDKKFFYERNLHRHINSEHGENNEYSCGQCKKIFNRKDTLARHQFEVHGNLGDGTYRFPGTTSINNNFSCEQCGVKFKRKPYLKRHINEVHQLQDRQYDCEKCGKKFTRQEKMKRHIHDVHELQDGQYVCEECGKKFKRQQDMKRHIHEVHELQDGQYVCEECGKKFKRQQDMKRHMHEVHELHDRQYVCEECGQKFERQENMKTHIHEVHEKEDPQYPCEKCDKKFKRKYHLNRHIHDKHDSSGWEYICDLCGKSFKSKSNLKEHLHTHKM